LHGLPAERFGEEAGGDERLGGALDPERDPEERVPASVALRERLEGMERAGRMTFRRERLELSRRERARRMEDRNARRDSIRGVQSGGEGADGVVRHGQDQEGRLAGKRRAGPRKLPPRGSKDGDSAFGERAGERLPDAAQT